VSETPPNPSGTSSTPANKVEQVAQTRPEMTIEELLNFSFRDATAAKVGSIIRRVGLSCS
jgi:hypothetical protein